MYDWARAGTCPALRRAAKRAKSDILHCHKERSAFAAQALATVLLKASLHPYAAVRDVAAAALAGACKRLPCLAPACLPHFLYALAGLPLPTDETLAAALGLPDPASIPGAQAGSGANLKNPTEQVISPSAVDAGDTAAGGDGGPNLETASQKDRGSGGGGEGGDSAMGGSGGGGGGGRNNLRSGGDTPVVPAALLAALREAVARPAAHAAAGDTTAAGAGRAVHAVHMSPLLFTAASMQGPR